MKRTICELLGIGWRAVLLSFIVLGLLAIWDEVFWLYFPVRCDGGFHPIRIPGSVETFCEPDRGGDDK
jgi:hypothetical protein